MNGAPAENLAPHSFYGQKNVQGLLVFCTDTRDFSIFLSNFAEIRLLTPVLKNDEEELWLI